MALASVALSVLRFVYVFKHLAEPDEISRIASGQLPSRVIGKNVRSIKQVKKGDKLSIYVTDGVIKAEATETTAIDRSNI